MQTIVRIKGMNCAHCVKAVDSALRKLATVKGAAVVVGEAVIETEGPVDLHQVREAIEDAGFEVES